MNNIDLTKGKISRHILKIAIPASTGFFFHTMYNVVDTFWAGKLSTTALASLSLSFPLYFLLVGLSVGVGTGTTALIGNALGGKNRLKAKHYAFQAIGFGMMFSILVSVFGIIFSPFILRMLGASGEYLEIALSYINIIFLGASFFILNQVLMASLNAAGDTKSFRNGIMAAFLLNVLLDPWFMFGGFGLTALGVSGIALATICTQAMGVIYLLFQIRKVDFMPKHALSDLVPHFHSWREIMHAGLSSSLSLITVALGIFTVNFFVKNYGKDAVAAYGIGLRIEHILLLVPLGLYVSVLAIVGQNNGAGKLFRIKKVITKSIIYGTSILVLFVPVLLFLGESVCRIFTANRNVIEIGAGYLRIAAFTLLGYTIILVSIAALQGMKKSLSGLWLGLYRQIIGALLLIMLFTKIFPLGLKGIWLAIFILVWTSVGFSFFYLRRIIREIEKV